ncbi:MAG: stage III sporulation AC/AD family protein, partial [Oscillospiraceae bacterium]|nr:stage III sporulation AC/AD family protein [Oscillospiraceae bacterium]
MNEIFTVAGLAVVSSGIAVLLKQYKPEYAFGAVFAFGIIIMLYIIGFFREIFELLQNLVSFSGIKESNFDIVLKCSG